MKNKKAQMNLSFGMIFSIILIIVFIAFAFYGIIKFLDYQKKIQIGQFTMDLQEKVNKMRSATEGSNILSYTLPTKINYICFTDFSKPANGPKASFYDDFQLVSSGEEKNMFFYPISASEGYELNLKNIDINNMTKQENPYCIESIKGKIKIGIRIGIGETLVTLTR